MTVDSSYNSATGPHVFFGVSKLLKKFTFSNILCVSGTHGAWPLHCAAMILCSANIKFHTHAHIYTDQFHLTPPSTLQPPTHLPDIPTPVPRGAMCTAGMAGVGSALHHCIGCRCTCPAAASSSNACTKSC